MAEAASPSLWPQLLPSLNGWYRQKESESVFHLNVLISGHPCRGAHSDLQPTVSPLPYVSSHQILWPLTRVDISCCLNSHSHSISLVCCGLLSATPGHGNIEMQETQPLVPVSLGLSLVEETGMQ